MVNKADEKEQYTERLPDVRLKKSQLGRLRDLAAKAGMSKKFSEWCRRRLLGEKIEEKPIGMPYQDVLANHSDLAALRMRLADRPDVLPIINRMSQRNLNALHHDPKIQHPR